MELVREVVFYKHYFEKFYNNQSGKTKLKIDEVLFMISILERVPIKFLKKIVGVKGLFEIRIEFEGNIYRVFCCFDESKLVILFNGFQKKSFKTPINEIRIATKLLNEYLTEKKNENNSQQ